MSQASRMQSARQRRRRSGPGPPRLRRRHALLRGGLPRPHLRWSRPLPQPTHLPRFLPAQPLRMGQRRRWKSPRSRRRRRRQLRRPNPPSHRQPRRRPRPRPSLRRPHRVALACRAVGLAAREPATVTPAAGMASPGAATARSRDGLGGALRLRTPASASPAPKVRKALERGPFPRPFDRHPRSAPRRRHL